MAIDIERLEILMRNCFHSFCVTHLIEDRLGDSLRNKFVFRLSFDKIKSKGRNIVFVGDHMMYIQLSSYKGQILCVAIFLGTKIGGLDTIDDA